MNALFGYIWLLSAVVAGAVSFRQRGRLGRSVVTFFYALSIQTGFAFAILAHIGAILNYRARAPMIEDLMGPSLALSVPCFWVYLLCCHRESNNEITKAGAARVVAVEPRS